MSPTQSTNKTSVGIVTINAQYAHTHPGIRILRNIAHDIGLSDAWIEEFTLADPVWKMAEVIARKSPKVLGISISIWNKESSIALARKLKSILPNVRIVAGGPETWFYPGTLEGVDCTIPHEGELAWQELLCKEFSLPAFAPPCVVEAYRDCDLSHVKGRMVYLETSRGCPFRCAFCQSGRKDAQLKTWAAGNSQHLAQTVDKLTKAGAHTIKFLDRTFNAHPALALEYFKALASVENAVCHFEICAELLNDETLNYLSSVPAGKFQFEIGVQSLHESTLQAIGRRTDTPLLLEKLRALATIKTVHVHADLIWGLPFDTFDSIVQGFNILYSLNLDELQLGFLKFLRGAPLESQTEQHKYRFDSNAPYEVLSHKNLSGNEILELKKVEFVFNRFHNSKRFPRTISYLMLSRKLSPFEFFSRIAAAFSERNLFLPALTIEKQCEVLLNIFHDDNLLKDYLRLDYTLSQKVFTLPRTLMLPNAKPPTAKQERGEHSICVVFEHDFNIENLYFSGELKTAVYKVTHRMSSGYFADVSIEPVTSTT